MFAENANSDWRTCCTPDHGQEIETNMLLALNKVSGMLKIILEGTVKGKKKKRQVQRDLAFSSCAVSTLEKQLSTQ